jgi:regulator of sirC expression with transglutaminase-like and TPR domain
MAEMDFLEDFAADAEFCKLLGRREDHVDLTAAALELARDAYPDLVFEPVFRWIDDRAGELRGPLAQAVSDEALLGELAACLAGRHGIVGSREIFEHADGSFLNRVIERKTGIPISLSVLYMAVAARTGIPLLGVAAPGHFLTSYETIDTPLFVDPFASGKIRTFDETVDWLEETQRLARESARSALQPVGPRLIIIRMLNNLKTLYAKQGEWRACWKVQHRLLALQPALYNERRDWAVIAVKAGRSGQALEMLERCLESCPAEDREFLEQQRQEARGKLAQWN